MAEENYLDLLKDVVYNGVPKSPVRFDSSGNQIKLSTDTIGLPNKTFSHDMATGFPLITTKFVSLKTIAVELEGFIKGITDKNWYGRRKCNIWNEWANPEQIEREFNFRVDNGWLSGNISEDDIKKAKAIVAKDCEDLGPIYGYQWRNFGEHYGNDEDFWDVEIENYNGIFRGCDQLKSIVDKLHTNPYDRRMYCSAWNPNQMHMMALPPCHLGWGVTAYGNKLHLNWTQRSCDAFLGVPYNIASYGLMLILLAKEANLEPGILTGNFIDFHIYDNHKSQVIQQLIREPFPLPKLEIENFKDIFSWTYEDYKLIDYNYHPAIRGEVTV